MFFALYFLTSLITSLAPPSILSLHFLQSSFMASPFSSMYASFAYKPPSAKIFLPRDKRYHVYLSFRGQDVRKTLVDHLYVELSAAGLNVFLDSEKFEKGETIAVTIAKAIESSAIRVPIFSKGYADSVWCLKEAAAMLDSPGLIIPLFYDVDPDDVRYPLKESSPYKQSFDKHYGHQDRYSREEIDSWKNALWKICECSRWSLDKFDGFEARLVKRVVNDIIETFHGLQFTVAEYLVGMDKVKNALIQKLSLNLMGEVVKVGIWGIGGIGKTTAAKAVYDQIKGDFKAACFVFNVRDTPVEASELTQLQKKVLKDLSKYSGEVGSVAEGISLFKCHLRKKPVMLVLDDLDKKEQLNALVGDWLAPGSRIIITSRDKQILNDAGISSEYIQEMSGLDAKEALQLFNWHVFRGESPSHNYMEYLPQRIVEACKGHPLSLEVIGSLSYGEQDIARWEEALHNISRLPSIYERLKISYNVLIDEVKEVFVDIACFFIGEHKYLPILFWKSFYRIPEFAVSNLWMKSLIKIDNNDVFGMHDHLRDMGRTIAETEKEGTRLWHDVQLSTISNNIHARLLRLSGGNSLRVEMLCRLPALRYLHLQNLTIEGVTNHTLAFLPPNLIWLRLENCHFADEMSAAIKKPMVDDIRQLKVVQLKFCHGVDSIFISPLCSLPNKRLLYLDLEGCVGLNNLPHSIGNLSQLQHLNLGGCVGLNNLPHTIGSLSQLQHLNLGGCYSLKNLPDTIAYLRHLQRLDLEECVNIKSLPESIGNLSALQILNLKDCISLQNLPDSIGNLLSLQYLNLNECINLQELPVTIDNLLPLSYLNLEGCLTLQDRPDTIGGASSSSGQKLG